MSDIRAPRLRVMFGGTEIPGAVNASVTVNNWYQADTFSLSFALYADQNFSAAWWSDQTDMLVDIQVGLQQTENEVVWQSILIGAVESLQLHPHTGLVLVTGKDLSVRFIQAKTQETFQNQTSSEIVTLLAARRGLKADVTATSVKAITYYQQTHANITPVQT